jgi:hypothetical protein
MFFAATLIDARNTDKDGNVKERKERKIVFNTEEIKYMMDNPDDPETTIVFTTKNPAVIKGTFEENSKVLLGFNRK